MVLGEPVTDEGNTGVQVALHGIDLAEHDTSAVLISSRIEGIYAHRLVRPAIAMDSVVDWLLRPPTEGAAMVGRTIEALLPVDPGRDAVTRTRAIVLGTGTSGG